MRPRWVAVLGMLGLLVGAARVHGQGVAGQATAARVNTPVSGAQTFASATMAANGGMNTADADAASVNNVLSAEALKSITTGQTDDSLVSVTSTAEATDVNVLNGLVSAKVAFALASSYANLSAATSESNGSTLLGLVVNGVAYGDGVPAPNTRITLQGVGYVVLNEQRAVGDGRRSSELTVTMIHVFLTDPVTGSTTGEIVVASARSAVSR